MRSEGPFRRTVANALVGCFLVGLGVTMAWPSVLGGVAPWADAVGPDDAGPAVRSADVTVPATFESIHRRGVTGGGVDVGILDVTGFDADHPALSGRIAGSRSFGDAAVGDGDPPRHGTAVAAAVGRLAPDASLHLAVAHDADGVAAAAEWIAARDVDVVVAPFNSLGARDDGTSRVSRALSRLRDEGVVVVASAGNFGRSHWAGRLAPTDDGRHRFDPNATRNRVYPAPRAVDAPATADVWLTWNGSRFARDLNLRLYRVGRDGERRVATSSRVPGGGVRREYLRAALPAGRYYLTVDVPERSRPVADDAAPRIEVTASGVVLGRTTPAGSVAAPAAARGVIGVGVAAPDGAVRPYSSRGPTADGRRGVDVVAPAAPFENVTALRGTSAAAAYVGATTALVAHEHPGATAATIERRVTQTATGTGRATPNATVGHGRVAPVDAVFDDQPAGSTVGVGRAAVEIAAESSGDTNRTPLARRRPTADASVGAGTNQRGIAYV